MPFQKQKLTAILAGDDIDAAAFGEPSRLNDIANAFMGMFLGGSRDGFAILGSGVQDIAGYVDFEIDGTDQDAGYVYTAIAEVLTFDTGTTVEPRIYDVTSPGSPVLYTTTGGSASASLTWNRQTLILDTLPSAVKRYRLRVNNSNASAPVRCLGYLFRSPA